MEQLVQSIERATARRAELTEITEVQDDTYRLVADITKIRRLGYVPQVSLDDGVATLAGEMGLNPELPSVDTIFKSGQHVERLP
jgi:UDP-glucose 4-epimerase